jgi:hypothetical protein
MYPEEYGRRESEDIGFSQYPDTIRILKTSGVNDRGITKP